MATSLEDFELLRQSENVCDEIWELIKNWHRFDREVVGSQLVRAADSIGANIAESHGRYHYGEKIQFLLYARGSLTEAQYWLRRCSARNLIPADECDKQIAELEALARNMNGYTNYLRRKRADQTSSK
jgi:four helix bundle protein